MSEKTKAKNIWLIIILSVLAFLIVAYSAFTTYLIYAAANNTDVWNKISANVFKQSEKLVRRNILTDTVSIEFPKDFVDLMSGFGFDFTEQIELNNIKKNDDGSVVIQMQRDYYNNFIKTISESTAESFRQCADGMPGSSIRAINFTKKFDNIILEVKKDEFADNIIDDMYIASMGYTAMVYQMCDVDAKGKCTIDIKDVDTGDIIKTVVYPDVLSE